MLANLEQAGLLMVKEIVEADNYTVITSRIEINLKIFIQELRYGQWRID